MKENIRFVAIAFVIALAFYFFLQATYSNIEPLTVSVIVFFGVTLLQLLLQIKRLLEK